MGKIKYSIPKIQIPNLTQPPKSPAQESPFRCSLSRGFRFTLGSRPYIIIPILNSGIKFCTWDASERLNETPLNPLLHSLYYIPVKNYPETFQCVLCFKLRPQAVTGLHRNARESISCVPSTGSRQVRLGNKAASISHSCKQCSAQNALGLQGQETTRTVAGGKTRSLFTCPDNSAITAASFASFQANHSRGPGST